MYWFDLNVSHIFRILTWKNYSTKVLKPTSWALYTYTCSSLSRPPGYTPRIAYFSHSLHLSEKDAKLTLNFVLGSPLLIFCIFIWVFICKIRKKTFFHILHKFEVPYIIRIIPGCPSHLYNPKTDFFSVTMSPRMFRTSSSIVSSGISFVNSKTNFPWQHL